MERGRCRAHRHLVDTSHNAKRPGLRLRRTRRWKNSSRLFLALNPECRCGCGHLSEIVDHVEPYISEEVRSFWDESNWQGLAKNCHSRKTRQELNHKVYL